MHSISRKETIIENKFAHNEEVNFRVAVRRCKLLGEWAAKIMAHRDANSYAEQVVALYFQNPDDEYIAARLLSDFKTAGFDMSLYEIRVKMIECLFSAVEQINA